MPIKPTRQKMLQFKIILLNVTPRIWRRIQVPYDFNFQQLHIAIQDSMGWFDCHLHSFYIKDKEASQNIQIGLLDESMDLEEDEGIKDETLFYIKDYFKEINAKVKYEYDFGDCWEHHIIFEGIKYGKSGTGPLCIGGKNPCPPEDIGGFSGFMEFVDKMKDPDHEDYNETRHWYKHNRTGADGNDFVPGKFNRNKVRFRKAKRNNNYSD